MTEEGKLGTGQYEQRLLKLLDSLNFFKFPLIIASIGVFLLLISIILQSKNNSSGREVIFSREASGSAQFSNKIRVDIEGAVKSPGVYEQGFDSRISDALEAAGGLSERADRDWIAKNLNLAAKLVDGGKIYIPSLGETSDGKNPKSQISNPKQVQNSNNQTDAILGVTTGLININSASQAELETLPGVGPVTAGKIIAGRPYQTLEELAGRKIIGKSLFEKIKELINI